MTIAESLLLLQEQGHVGDFEIAQARFLAQRAFPDHSEHEVIFAHLLLGLLACLRKGSTVASRDDLLALWPAAHRAVVKEQLEFLAQHAGSHNIFSLVWTEEPTADAILHPLVIQNMQTSATGTAEPLWGFSRMWVAETELARNLLQHLHKALHYPQTPEERERFCAALTLAKPAFEPHVRQWMAVLHAMVSPFCVISGGPGTGKTTLVRMLVQAIGHYRHVAVSRMALCAPTGRAKARLLQGVLEGTDAQSPLRALTSKTLYALLGLGSDGEPRWNRDNPLPYDLIVVDESSMVDVWMFARLLEALHPGAALILVGDMDQLPSVEAGAVLGDLTAALREQADTLSWPEDLRKHFRWLREDSIPQMPGWKATQALLAAQLDLPAVPAALFSGKVSFLTENQRSKESPEILQWWHALPAAPALYNPVLHYADLHALFEDARVLEHLNTWVQQVHSGWGRFIQGKSSEQIALFPAQQFSRLLTGFMVLCCVNDGPSGRHSVNKLLEARFRSTSAVPIIVERNTSLGDFTLYNGDLGLCFRRHGLDYGAFAVDGRIRCVELRRLPEWSLAYAITVHKAQGSEFSHVLLLLPGTDQGEVSRQLVYTGITRARMSLLVNDPAERLSAALSVDLRRSRFVDILQKMAT